MSQQGGFERRQLLVGHQPSEAFLGLHHTSSGPAQSHRGIPPALHVAGDLPDGAVHVLDDVGAGQRAGEHKIPWGVGGWPVLVQASRVAVISNLVFGRPMRVQIQLRIVSDDDTVLSEDVIACFDKGDDQLEEIGLSLDQALFTEHTAPELLYLETRWASLMSFGLTAGLLKDVLPVDIRTNAATIRNHLHKVALRQEAELGDERPRIVEGDPAGGKELPMPEGPIVVGIDGAYLRNWHDKGKKFEVIVGKSVPEVRDHRYFGLVQTHDDKPGRRLIEVLHGQDLQINQSLTFLTDGGDSSFLDEISPCAENYLD